MWYVYGTCVVLGFMGSFELCSHFGTVPWCFWCRPFMILMMGWGVGLHVKGTCVCFHLFGVINPEYGSIFNR